MRIVEKLPGIRDLIFHPFVFAVFPILSLYVKNMHMTSPAESFRSVVFLLICAALLWFLVSCVVKSGAKSAIIVSALAMLFLPTGMRSSG